MHIILLTLSIFLMCHGIYAQDRDSWLRLNASYTLGFWNSIGPKLHFS